MKRVLSLALVAALLIAGPASASEATDCEYDGMSMVFTGKTKTEWGKLFMLYKCPTGHAWWVPSDQAMAAPSYSAPQAPVSNYYRPPAVSDACPVCGMSCIWTGQTYTEFGKLYKVYRCPAGHKSVGPF